jgi:DNA replication protein DnaC
MARFPAGKTFESWVEDRSSIPAAAQRSLRSLEWNRRAENLIVAGPSGTGKSHLLEAIGLAAEEQGLTVAWFSMEDLGAIVRRHRVDDTVPKTFAALGTVTLTVVHDIGLWPISQDAAEGLCRLVDASYQRRSLALSSNLHQFVRAKLFVVDGHVRHQAPHNRMEMKGLHRRAVAADRQKLGAA